MLLKEIAVQLMEHLCNHDWHGYSQVSRYGDGEGTCPVTIGGKTYYLEQGDRDCSSGVITAFEAAGISCGGATYTGNMRSCMVGTGNFRWHPMSDGYIAQRGDVYLNESDHTAMCISAVPDMLAEFSISETGGIDGAEGDQTGRESYIHDYYDYPWDGILECICTDTDSGTAGDKPTDEPATDNGGIDICYSVMLKDGTVLPEIKNLEPDSSGDNFAGIVGKEIYGIAIRVTKGSIKYRVRTVDGVLHEFVTGCDFSDYWNGYAGDGEHAIATLEAYLYSPNGDKYVYYRLSPVEQDYYPYQRDMDKNSLMDGYAGEPGVAVDRLQMYIA